MPIVLLSIHSITQHLRSLHLWRLETFSRATIFLSPYENVTPGTNRASYSGCKGPQSQIGSPLFTCEGIYSTHCAGFLLYYFPLTIVTFSCFLSLLLDIPKGTKIIFTTQICKNIPFFFKTTFIFIFEPQFLG